MIANWLQNHLFAAGLKNVIILIIAGNRFKIAKAVFANFIMAFGKQEKFQFGCRHRVKAHFIEPCQLPLKNGAGRMGNGAMAMMIKNIAKHHHGSVKPWHWAHGLKDRLHHIIAIACLPRG